MTQPRDTQIVIAPNASMTTVAAWQLMAVMTAVSMGIAIFFAWHGLWPVLPFAGLELAALAWALKVSLRQNRYREVVAFEGSRIRIECGVTGFGARLAVDWPRSSTRVLLEAGFHRNDPTSLSLGNGSRRIVLGRCLTDEEREALAARLRALVLDGWRAGGPEAVAVLPTDGN